MEHLDVDSNIWMDALAWTGRGEVGLKFALINARFNDLVDEQLQQRKWRLGEFHICQRSDGTGAEAMTKGDNDSNFITLPLATTPLPDSIIGFKTFSIWYIDENVITFLRIIRRLFTSNIAIEFSTRLTEYRSWKAMARHIWPLLQNGISTLVNVKKSDIALLHKHVSPTVLLDCANLLRIYTTVLPECPTDRGNDDKTGRSLFTWIHSPRIDDGPLVLTLLRCKDDDRLDCFLEEMFKCFEQATFAVHYVVLVYFPFVYRRNERLDNVLTGERLTLTTNMVATRQGLYTNVVLMRAPLGIDGQRDDEMDKIVRARFNLVHIGFNDHEIGPLPSAAAAEPSSTLSTSNSL